MLGAPLQVAVILWGNLGKKRVRRDKKGKKEGGQEKATRIRKQKPLTPEKMLDLPPQGENGEGAEE